MDDFLEKDGATWAIFAKRTDDDDLTTMHEISDHDLPTSGVETAVLQELYGSDYDSNFSATPAKAANSLASSPACIEFIMIGDLPVVRLSRSDEQLATAIEPAIVDENRARAVSSEYNLLDLNEVKSAIPEVKQHSTLAESQYASRELAEFRSYIYPEHAYALREAAWDNFVHQQFGKK